MYFSSLFLHSLTLAAYTRVGLTIVLAKSEWAHAHLIKLSPEWVVFFSFLFFWGWWVWFQSHLLKVTCLSPTVTQLSPSPLWVSHLVTQLGWLYKGLLCKVYWALAVTLSNSADLTRGRQSCPMSKFLSLGSNCHLVKISFSRSGTQ